MLQVTTADRAVVAIEPHGWACTEPALAERLSADGGHYMSVYWSPSGFRIVEGRSGRLVGAFDPLFLGMPAGAGDLLPGWVEIEDFATDRVEAASLAALAEHTGVHVTREWRDRPFPTYRR